MKLYFACSTKKGIEYLVKEHSARNILFSYAYIKDCSFLKEYKDLNILVDSGAFTAWTKGKNINITEYADYIKEEIDPFRKRHNITVINLDVIPGEFGRKASKEEKEESVERGFGNFFYLKKRGIESMHTFHMFESVEVLERIKKVCGYIGISPANDVSVSRRLKWLKGVYNNIRTDYKAHILGLSSDSMLRDMPIYSCDSTRWLGGAMFGNVTGVKDKSLKRFYTRRGWEKSVEKNVKEVLNSEALYTELWKKRGIEWLE